MYKINDTTYALEKGDNLSFVKDGGGTIQVWMGNCEQMKSHDPNFTPSYAEEEQIVLRVGKK
jgi:hypothetical protein